MRDDLAESTFAVLSQGLDLHDKLRKGASPNLRTEQQKLKGLLGSASQGAPWGEGSDAGRSYDSSHDRFLGIRYALACWLDELFINYAPASWSDAWNREKLEYALFQQQLAYSEFWRQARLAEGVPSSGDALEAFLLCVLLGFRGEIRERPEELREWVKAQRARCAQVFGQELPPLPEKAPESSVPLLQGVNGYRSMVRILTAGILIAVPLVAFFLISLLR